MQCALTMKSLLFPVLCPLDLRPSCLMRGRVVAVSNGDTVTLLEAERTFFIVLADIRQGLREMRVGHFGHGDQDVVHEVH